MDNTIETVKSKILNAVQSATGWVSIFGPANGPEPANQYCLVTLMSQEKEDHDVINWTKTDTILTENQRSESQLTFEIQARGNDAMSIIDKITSYFDSSLRDIDLWDGTIGYGGHDDGQNISVAHQGKMLPVGVVNIYIHTTIPEQNTIEYMNNFDITTKIGNNITIGPITVSPSTNQYEE